MINIANLFSVNFGDSLVDPKAVTIVGWMGEYVADDNGAAATIMIFDIRAAEHVKI